MVDLTERARALREWAAQPAEAPPTRERLGVDGKFLRVDGATIRIRGATYGSFARRGDGEPFPESSAVQADFRAMGAVGLNTVRTYALPPHDVLEAAADAGLRLLVGLDYHDWRMEPSAGAAATRRVLDAGRRAIEQALERCDGRSEVFALCVGNEVPGDLVRLHGIGAVEDALSTMVAHVHDGAPELLATYANYPTTEYLRIEGQDFASFNVFLESPADFQSYVRHLQVVAGDLPLVITELGLPAGVHGDLAQRASIDAQLRIVDESGCAGATIFSWTDDWAVNDERVEGWGFGLTDAAREPRPALECVRAWTAQGVCDLRSDWPRVSVVVCAHNEEALIGRCLESLDRCAYPDLEVIVCDDGSTDDTRAIAETFPFEVLTLPHVGLSRARTEGFQAATGEVIAYLDADAECHPEWPYHLVLSLTDDRVMATGGPNVPPPDAPFTERAVDQSPGGPIHVLVSDDRAEHVPGCNMAFRREALAELGGFDPIFTAAGDDVDVCWRLLDAGHEIAFAPAAQIRHHRPSSVRTYFRQQRSYGRAERLLQGRHRHRFNTLGQSRWSGSIYGGPRVLPNLLRPVVYHGQMGFAPFQRVARRRSEVVRDNVAAALPLLALPLLAGALAPLSLWWLIAPAAAVATLVAYAITIAAAVRPPRNEPHPVALRVVVACLHVAQPFVRTWGRLRGPKPPARPDVTGRWSGERGEWLRDVMRDLRRRRCGVRAGEVHDDYDLAVSIGPFVSCRVRTAVAWDWLPRYRLRLRPRWTCLAVLAGVIVLPYLVWAGAVIIAALVMAMAIEAFLLYRTVGASLDRTSHQALVEQAPANGRS
jgi:O-antigen biosynthesis protein